MKMIIPKTLIEYPLPAARETHELIGVNENKTIMISQQTDSSLVKVNLDPDNGTAKEVARFTIGNPRSGIHGLKNSEYHPGMFWCTLQFDNKVLLLDPLGDQTYAEPKVLQEIDLPAPARGPHVVVEYGEDLWITLKDSHHVMRVNHTNPSDYNIYKAARNPIFVAKNRHSGNVYASQDQSSAIICIDPQPGTIQQIPIPADHGSTPVGLIEGPDGNVWFVLLGSSEGGTGTFGRILVDGSIQYYKLKNNLGKNTGLLHLAFAADPEENGTHKLYLLSSSIISSHNLDAFIELGFNEDYKAIDTISTFVMPTQLNKSHRVLPLPTGIYGTELATSILSHLASNPTEQTKLYDETADYYSNFGYGVEGNEGEYKGAII